MAGAFETIMELSTGYWASAAFLAGVETGVFEALGRERRTAAEVAQAAGASAEHVARLMDALAGLGILEKRGGAETAYGIAPGAVKYLAPDGRMALLDALRFNIDLYPLWGRLGTSVREGRPALPPSAHLGMDAARTRRFVLGMHSRAVALAPAVAAATDLSGARRVLDVGAGPGTFARVLAERNEELEVTLFDLPPVVAIAKELSAGHVAEGRLAFVGGDYRRDALPGGFDAVLYSGALHQETPESAAALVAKMRASLASGGRLVVMDMMLDAGGTTPVFSTLFSLNMMLTSPAGRVFASDAVKRLLACAGFADISARDVPDTPYRIVAGRLP